MTRALHPSHLATAFLLLALASAYVGAQIPPLPPETQVPSVPRQFEQVATGTISGTARDSTGAVIPGIEIEVEDSSTGATRTVLTDDFGRFIISNLPQGQYIVSASMHGFGRWQGEITVGSGESISVDIRIGGPVPPAEPQPPRSRPPSDEDTPTVADVPIEVIQRGFRNKSSVEKWLNVKADRGYELIGVVPIRNEVSLFAFRKVDSAPEYVVFRVSGRVSRKSLIDELELRSEHEYQGIHTLNEDAYLLIMRR